MAGQGNGTFKQIWSTFLKVTGLSSADTPSWLRSLVALNLRSNLDLSQKNCLHFCLAWVFWGIVVAPPFFTFLAPLAGNTKSKNWTSVPFQESCPHVHERTWPHNGAFHVLNWSFPPGGRSGLGPKSGLVFSCSHSGNSSKLSTRSGRVKLLKVTGGIRGQDWVLTHYAMMLREKCDGNSRDAIISQCSQ